MISIRQGDLFSTDAEIIAHQVNCQGVMGSGVAKQVREKYPNAYIAYRRLVLKDWNNRKELLGIAQITPAADPEQPFFIANLFGQYDYGRFGEQPKQYTDINALTKCFKQLAEFVKTIQQATGKFLRIAMPYRIGCARGGANWNEILNIIQTELGDLDVVLYRIE